MVLQIFRQLRALDQRMDIDPDLVRLLQILKFPQFFREIKVFKNLQENRNVLTSFFPKMKNDFPPDF